MLSLGCLFRMCRALISYPSPQLEIFTFVQGFIGAEQVGMFREERIAILNHLVHLGKVELMAILEGQGIKLTAPHDEQSTVSKLAVHLIERAKDTDAIHSFQGSAEYPIFTTGQGTGKRFPGFSSHQEDMPHGYLLEPLEIIWQTPGQVAILANDPVLRNGGYGFQAASRHHIAIGALIAG